MNIIELSNKNIIITGAGSGIGRETAIVASKLGAKTILLDISEENWRSRNLSRQHPSDDSCRWRGKPSFQEGKWH